VKIENPNVCVTVNCKVCGNSNSAVLPVVPSSVYKVLINPIQNPSINHTKTPKS
jgi:hypothetical protein